MVRMIADSMRLIAALSCCLFILLGTVVSSTLGDRPQIKYKVDEEMAFALKPNDSIAFFGDSQVFFGAGIPYGFVNLVRKEIRGIYPSVKVIDIGLRDHITEKLNGNIDFRLFSHDVNKVFIITGIDDIKLYTTREDVRRFEIIDNYAADLEEIVRQCVERDIKAILVPPIVLGEKVDGTNDHDDLLEEFAGANRKLSEKYNCGFVDVYFLVHKFLEKWNEENMHLGIITINGEHLNESGHMLIASALLRYLGVQDHPYYDHPLLDKTVNRGYMKKEVDEGDFRLSLQELEDFRKIESTFEHMQSQ
jgi:hypothetical protein